MKRFEEEEVQTGTNLLENFKWKQTASVEIETDPIPEPVKKAPTPKKPEPFAKSDWADSEIFRNVHQNYEDEKKH